MRDDVRVASRKTWYVAVVLAATMTAGGCGTASPQSPPTGVDELVIPTPSPDPDDFVARIDNPWLPYAAEHQWEYTERIGVLEYTRSVKVLPDTVPVAGVATTVVETVTAPLPIGTPSRTRDYYAQDRHGNVWWFGRDGQWRAGEDDAVAGLAMPANPRLGDGWRMAYQPDVVDVRATVVSLDQEVTTPAGRYDDLVELEIRNPLEPDKEARALYARDVGLVQSVSTGGPVDLVELESAPS